MFWGTYFSGQFHDIFIEKNDVNENVLKVRHLSNDGIAEDEICFALNDYVIYEQGLNGYCFLGYISKITEKTVTINPRWGKTRRLRIDKFLSLNHNLPYRNIETENHHAVMNS